MNSVVARRIILRVGRVLCCISIVLALRGAGRAQNASVTPPHPPLYTMYLANGGCQPARTQPKQGEFLLLVINLSLHPDVTLTLHAADGSAQAAAQQFSGARRSSIKRLNLAAGRYTLDGANSEHHCRIDVQ